MLTTDGNKVHVQVQVQSSSAWLLSIYTPKTNCLRQPILFFLLQLPIGKWKLSPYS